MKTEAFLNSCTERTKGFIERVNQLKQMPLDVLNWKASSESWSVLECLEHLNLYAAFYNPEIRLKIASANNFPAENYKSGLLWGYFAKSMLPSENMKKMKTFKDKNPSGSSLDMHTISKFLEQQHEFLELLKMSEKVDLNKTKTAISISKWLKLRLGDTFHFVINHNERHFAQIDRTLKDCPTDSNS